MTYVNRDEVVAALTQAIELTKDRRYEDAANHAELAVLLLTGSSSESIVGKPKEVEP